MDITITRSDIQASIFEALDTVRSFQRVHGNMERLVIALEHQTDVITGALQCGETQYMRDTHFNELIDAFGVFNVYGDNITISDVQCLVDTVADILTISVLG